MPSCQKLGIILENNWYKNVLLNSYYPMKKIRKIWMIFDVKNWLWKSNFCTLWHLPIPPIHKIQWFYLTTVNFQPKTFLLFVSPSLKLHNCHTMTTLPPLPHQKINKPKSIKAREIWIHVLVRYLIAYYYSTLFSAQECTELKSFFFLQYVVIINLLFCIHSRPEMLSRRISSGDHPRVVSGFFG